MLGDLVSILSGEAPVHVPQQALAVSTDLESSFYLHLEVADRPGVLAAIADVLGRNEISVQSVVQRGLGDDARLVMVLHEAPERASTPRSRRSPGSSSCAPPRGRSG